MSKVSDCKYFGEPTGEETPERIFGCAIHGTCTPKTFVDGHACCNGSPDERGVRQPCPAYVPIGVSAVLRPTRHHKDNGFQNPSAAEPWRWSYGVTTVPERHDTLLPKTLASLKDGGFDYPTLFVDGVPDIGYYRDLRLPVVTRWPQIRTYGNWYLALMELYIRNPVASRYAIFQDDIIVGRNLCSYLDRCEMTPKTYWNLYTHQWNQKVPHDDYGFYESAIVEGYHDHPNRWQMGLGAVALVFSREGVQELLSSRHMAERPTDVNNGHRSVDGGVVTAMNKAGWREHVHDPSLVQHVGLVSSMGNRQHEQALSFRGEQFDCMEMSPIPGSTVEIRLKI